MKIKKSLLSVASIAGIVGMVSAYTLLPSFLSPHNVSAVFRQELPKVVIHSEPMFTDGIQTQVQDLESLVTYDLISSASQEEKKPEQKVQPPISLEDFYINPKRYQAVVPNLTERDLATAVRIAYNETGFSEPTEGIHGAIWAMINRLNREDLFQYGSLTDVGLAPNQFQPVWPSGPEPSPLYADLFDDSRDAYEPIPESLTKAHVAKLIDNGWKEEEAKTTIEEYNKKISNEILKVLAGEVPDPTNGGVYFKNTCKTGGIVWHNRTPLQIWGNGRNDIKLWFTTEIGNHWYYTVVDEDYDEPIREVKGC